MYTETEIRFLLGRHIIERATGDRLTTEMVDLRQLGCPLLVFNRILSHRAIQLGKRFANFRAANSATAAPSALQTVPEIDAVRLF